MPANRTGFASTPQRNGLSDYDITTARRGSDGNLWLGTPNSGAMQSRAAASSPTARRTALRRVNDIFEDRAGDLCFKGTVLGDARTSVFEGATLSLLTSHEPRLHTRYGAFDGHAIPMVQARCTQPPWAGSTERVTLQARDGEWWVGTGDGLYRFPAAEHLSRNQDGARRPSTRTKDGLAATQVFRLFEDSRGDVWISTMSSLTRGLAVWDAPRGRVRDLAAIARAAVVPGRPASGICRRRLRQRVDWVQRAGWSARRGRSLRLSPSAMACRPARSWTSTCDRAGRLWLASAGGGLVRVDHPGEARPAFVQLHDRAGTVEQ